MSSCSRAIQNMWKHYGNQMEKTGINLQGPNVCLHITSSKIHYHFSVVGLIDKFIKFELSLVLAYCKNCNWIWCFNLVYICLNCKIIILCICIQVIICILVKVHGMWSVILALKTISTFKFWLLRIWVLKLIWFYKME